jgi:hypothetical protein
MICLFKPLTRTCSQLPSDYVAPAISQYRSA